MVAVASLLLLIVIDSERIIVVREADLGKNHVRQYSSVKFIFLIHPMKIVTFSLENGETPTMVVGFLLAKDTFLKKNMEIDDDFLDNFLTITTTKP